MIQVRRSLVWSIWVRKTFTVLYIFLMSHLVTLRTWVNMCWPHSVPTYLTLVRRIKTWWMSNTLEWSVVNTYWLIFSDFCVFYEYCRRCYVMYLFTCHLLLATWDAFSVRSNRFLVEYESLASRGCVGPGPSTNLWCKGFRWRVSITLQRSLHAIHASFLYLKGSMASLPPSMPRIQMLSLERHIVYSFG